MGYGSVPGSSFFGCRGMLFFRWQLWKPSQCLCSDVCSIIMYMGAGLGTEEIMDCNIKAGFSELTASGFGSLVSIERQKLSLSFSTPTIAKLLGPAG